jgi:hypothetical protein
LLEGETFAPNGANPCENLQLEMQLFRAVNDIEQIAVKAMQ